MLSDFHSEAELEAEAEACSSDQKEGFDCDASEGASKKADSGTSEDVDDGSEDSEAEGSKGVEGLEGSDDDEEEAFCGGTASVLYRATPWRMKERRALRSRTDSMLVGWVVVQ
jgi:hypothetical protein